MPSHINHTEENALQSYLQARLMEIVSQLRVPFPRYFSLDQVEKIESSCVFIELILFLTFLLISLNLKQIII